MNGCKDSRDCRGNLTEHQWVNILMAQMQERNHAWHQMRARSMQYTLWILGLAVAASWHLLQDPCDGLVQRLAVTVLVIALGTVSFYFLYALNQGVKNNKRALISIETELGLHDEQNPILPGAYKKKRNGKNAHFISLYALLLVTLLYLLLAIWVPVYTPNKTSMDSETNTKQTSEVTK